MKIMLIDPYFEEGLKGFSLGLAYIAGALIKDHTVLVLDLTAKSAIYHMDPDDVLIKEFNRFNPDIVGVTSTSPTHKNALHIAKIIKKIKNVPIIKGGPHESGCLDTTIKNNPEIDFTVVGEGEETIVELVNRIAEHKSVCGVQGVVFREDGKIIINSKRKLIPNLNNLPKPARDLFYLNKEFDDYYSSGLFNGKKSTSIITSRGCPYSCSFCSSKAGWGMLRQRSTDNVIEEIEELYSQGFRGFMFEDDMSLLNKAWFFEFAKKLQEKGLSIEYSLQTRVDVFKGKDAKKLAKVLKKSGCKFIYFGVESGNQEILNKCGKAITIKQAELAFQIVRQQGIRSMASIQFGLLGEDLENLSTVRETIKILNEQLKPDEVAISYTALYPGSPLANKYGVTPEMYESYVKTGADSEIYTKTAHGTHSIHTPGLTSEKIMEIEKILREELRIKRFDVGLFYNT